MLTITELHKSYGSTRALDGVSLSVAPGEMVGFVGANGAGKSTTMRIAMGLLAAVSGAVRWTGVPVDFEVRRRFGYMPEERGLYPRMRVVEQVAYFGRLRGMSAAAASAAAGRLVESMDVVAGPRDQLQSLSLGSQQRVQLAAALVHDPELLILDEPFSGLDPVWRSDRRPHRPPRDRHPVAAEGLPHRLRHRPASPGSFVATSNPDGTHARVLSIVPPVSAIAMPSRIAGGGVAWYDVALAVVLLLLAASAMTAVGGRVYRASVLHSGTRVPLRRAWRGEAAVS